MYFYLHYPNLGHKNYPMSKTKYVVTLTKARMI